MTDWIKINERWSGPVLRRVTSLDEAQQFLRWLGERRPILAIDTETGGFDWWRDALRTVQFGDGNNAWCLQIEGAGWGGLAAEALERYDAPLAMHNAKFDTHFLEVNGYTVKRHLVHDTRAMAHLLRPQSATALKERASRMLGPWAKHGEDEMKLAMMKGNFSYATIPVDLLWQYAAFDTVLTARIAEMMWPEIEANFRALYDLELATALVLTDMERRGAMTDRVYLARTHEEWELEERALAAQLKGQWGIANPGSRTQLAQRIAQDGHQFVEFTATGKPKMTEDILETLDHPIARAASRMLRLHKHKKTYIGALIDLGDVNGLVHCQVNPLGARTGRMSASRPPLQQLPRSAEVRDAFIPSEGCRLVLADFDQIEMRLLAHFSQDRAMLEAIHYGDAMTAAGYDGWDVHSANARTLFQVPPDQPVPKPQRQIMKSSGFAKVYGAGVAKFAATAGVDLGSAQAFLNAYDHTFPGVNAFQRRVESTLRERAGSLDRSAVGYVDSPYGRRHPVDMGHAYRGVNYLIQGTAADVMKDRLVALANVGLLPYMVLPVHDEIIFDIPVADVPAVKQIINQVMPERERFSVPLTAEVKEVARWGDAYRVG